MLHASLLFSLLLQTPAPQQPPTFAAVVTAHFAAWDTDHDGTLSNAEIDALCTAPDVHGEEAAAAASLKRIVRSGKFTVPPLTLPNLTAPPPRTAGKPKAPEPANDPQHEPEAAPPPATTGPAVAAAPAAGALPPANFPATYVRSLARIKTAKRELFLDPTPDLDKCRQGPLGDCYFVASVGAFVARDPVAITKLVTQLPDGGYVLQFGDGRMVKVPPLTDAELALSGSTGDEGLWLPVLEKGLGVLRHEENPAKYKTEAATDAIANGGSTATILKLLTGHDTERIQLKRQPRSREKGPDGKPVMLPPVAAGSVEELVGKVRPALVAAFAEKRLVTCGTGTEAQPPGISGKHAYAVLGFDDAASTVRLWNPHGNTFKPKGDAGLKNGYPTAAGVFTMPLAEYVQVFRGVVIEKAAKVVEKTEPAKTAGG